MSAVLPNVDTLSVCEICIKKTWRVSLSIGVRITMISGVVYLLGIFKMFDGLMNNLVFSYVKDTPRILGIEYYRPYQRLGGFTLCSGR